MREIEISGHGLIKEFKRREIEPDHMTYVNQGWLFCWEYYGGYAVELALKGKKGGFISGALYSTGKYDPQKMADSLCKSID